MSGIDRNTGKVLSGFPHVAQSIGVIVSTRLASRVIRRMFGAATVGLLGRNLTPNTLLKFWTAIVIAIELWEPRYRVRQILYPQPPNSAANLAVGRLGIAMAGDYMPRALEGDFTVEDSPQINV